MTAVATHLRCPMCQRLFGVGARFCPDDGAALVAEEVRAGALVDDPWLGQVLVGRYRLLEVIGRGGMGVVYAAEQLPIGRIVAVKRLRSERGGGEKARARFLREALLVSRLKSPWSVRLYDFGHSEGGEPFLVMERLEGETLRQHMERRRLATDEVVRVLGQVARALAEAHAIGVIHRDVKPDNVVLEPTLATIGGGLEARVLDFGIARMTAEESPLTETSQVPGTPQYLAPERIAGEEPGPAADVYALGVMAYELLSGAPPFSGTPWEVMQAHASGRLRPLTEAVTESGQTVPEALASLVMRMLARAPELRPADGSEVARLIEELGAARVGRSGAGDDGPAVASTMDDLRRPVAAPIMDVETGTAKVFGRRARLAGAMRGVGLVALGLVAGILLGRGGVGVEPGVGAGAGAGPGVGVEAGAGMEEGAEPGTGVEPGAGVEPSAGAGAGPGGGVEAGAGAGAGPGGGVEAGAGVEVTAEPSKPRSAPIRRPRTVASPGGEVEPPPPRDPDHARIDKLLP